MDKRKERAGARAGRGTSGFSSGVFRSGFTLLELLVVIGIMGLLGTVSVGGYRQMQRGMSERGVMDNVNAFVRAAYQRAQVDRQPTAVYFWNETLRKADDYNTEIVVGKAVAIRRYGRISKYEGQLLYDEFNDLNLSYSTDDSAEGAGAENAGGEGKGDSKQNTMYLYPIDDLSNIEDTTQLKRSIVYQKVFGKRVTPMFLSGQNGVLQEEQLTSAGVQGIRSSSGTLGEFMTYAFKVDDPGNVQWKTGMAYGFEFAQLELPHGFIFGNQRSTDVNDPVRGAGTIVFGVGKNSGNGVTGGLGSRYTVTVSELLPNTSGDVEPQQIGTSQDPTKDLQR